ncbi:S-type pyocin domain-containing protein [Salinivibrio sp. YCSC6]|uniref:T6SS effector antibacterial DNase n=1 Tax=Salinivibrio sp. YCSC6 TaxID=2003370 RepID=UPI000BBC5002|nr:S-type pyocin domain-containing protein [Salinivibrio sp. YCSC6]PCE69340.1 S-type Pyocin domain-containing protein [Salinivibrio sp. YCSC6]QCF37206.1 S-type Pyocin domain-containing protein [Salinivibrio sp. YCSC6]
MSYEFGQVEGDISTLSERDVSNIIPDGVSFSQFKGKLDSGEYALLTDTPTHPAMVHDSVNKIWSVAPGTDTSLSPQARSALSARANQSGNVAGGASGSDSASTSSHGATTNIEDTYVPEPVKPDRSDVPPALKYEYCFEIAASDKTFRKAVGCTFQIAKTEQEGVIGQWQTESTEHGTKYKAYAAFDEPKKLLVKVSADTMGISVPQNIVMKPEGSATVREAFIPVVPSVQLGERLGLPTEGYYYHFHQKRLVQEYKLLGDGKWQFQATRSTHEKLNHEEGVNKYQSAILVYWKIGGKEVEEQHLVYLNEPITRDKLDNLSDEWLEENGIKLSIGDLLAAPTQPVAERGSSSANDADSEPEQAEPETHQVATDPDTRQRESWGTIAGKYGLSAKQLLDLNPAYNADPMSLKVGDTLIVQQAQAKQSSSEAATELPPLSPCAYNCAENAHYDYSEPFIAGTPFKAINNDSLLERELPVANLTAITTASKATDYGKAAILTLPASGAATNLGVISTNTAKTMGTWSLSSEALAGFARMGGFLVAALWPSQLGDGTLDGHPELGGVDAVTMRVRFNMYTDENGKQQVVGIKTGEGSPYGERVTKREARQNGQNFVAELDDGITITWTPDGSTDVLTPDTVLPENDQLDVHNIWVRPIEEHEQEIGTPLYPEEDLAEYLVTFPADAGLPPLYLVFRKTARDESGVVTGNGEDITGRWLEKASEDLGAPIPSQIADKLRGKEFSSFDAFRKAFWTEVASDKELAEQFNGTNLNTMKNGRAPFCRKRERVGGRVKYEIHHVDEIQHGGEVYNVDNLKVVSPKTHIEIHKAKR